ncbi:tol-pal system YbgF family protein [Candidatus Riflebacteria bacterium]
MDKGRFIISIFVVIGVIAIIIDFRLVKIFSAKSSKVSLFEVGRKKACEAKFTDSVQLFQQYLKKNPHAKNASRASFFIGKAHLGMGDLVKAEQQFQKTIRDFPASLESHKSHYKIALIKLLHGNFAAAEKDFTALAERKNGPLTAEAIAMKTFLQTTNFSTRKMVPAAGEE